MPFTATDVVYGFALPTLVAMTLCRGLGRRHSSVGGRWLPIVGLLAAFHLGYWLLALGPFVPDSHWHWLPWSLLLAIVGVLPQRGRRMGRVASISLTLVAATITGWLIIPTWDHLEPSRLVYLVSFVIVVTSVTMLLEPLTERYSPSEFTALLALVMTCGAVILALSGSLRFAQMAGCGVAGLAGMTLASLRRRRGNTAAGIALPFTLLLTALMLIGRVNSFSDVPAASYLLLPLAPLALWLGIQGPLAHLTGISRRLVLILPLFICAAAIALAVVAELPSESVAMSIPPPVAAT